ncbi:MAG TPA: toll/interleukin-1 receptor domain-containing protein [Xanthobacteraceae bacterium]|jgi:hypothetical protein|nr:toll/interleukin-1 receptor domain-containing protein [Xanthobacteraceae bacterium]
MSSLADLPELIGFFSYSRDDDESYRGRLSALREAIQHELSAQLGRSKTTFRLWQDTAAIAPGRLWESDIQTAVEQSVFFIPIVTPRAVNSDYCKFEFHAFLAREHTLGRSDLVFPILYVPVPALANDAQWRNHPILSVIGKRQYVDWQSFRHVDVPTPAMREAIGHFCRNIVEALHSRWVSPEERRQHEEAEALQRADDERRRQAAEATRRAEAEARRLQTVEQQRIAEERRRPKSEIDNRVIVEEPEPKGAEALAPAETPRSAPGRGRMVAALLGLAVLVLGVAAAVWGTNWRSDQLGQPTQTEDGVPSPDSSGLPDCDSDVAKQMLSDALKKDGFTPVQFGSLWTESSSAQAISCGSILTLPGRGTVAVNYSFQLDGHTPVLNYAIAPASSH